MKQWIKITSIKKLKFTPFNKETDKDIRSGVYRMIGKNDQIIYIGKSKNLYDRINKHLSGSTHINFLDEVQHIEWCLEPKYENLLESILIAFYEPQYNAEVKNPSE